MPSTVTVHVPGSSANLGPAFDCLALALDIRNEVHFALGGEGLKIEISGEGAAKLPRNEKNLIYRAFQRLYEEVSQPLPQGLHIQYTQRVPPGSGLGSSAAARLAGLLGANELLGQPLKADMILQLGAELEGHADNFAASQFGGLVLITRDEWRFSAQQLECAPLQAVFILPDLQFGTRESRGALPKDLPMASAVFNIGKSLQTAEALRKGDIQALATAMQDKLHQPYRLPLILGAAEALVAARKAGAAAALSGAGPGLIAFIEEGGEKVVSEAMRAAFEGRGVKAREFLLKSSAIGAEVEVDRKSVV